MKIKILLKVVPKGPINNKSALVQVMVRCWSGHYAKLSQAMQVSSMHRDWHLEIHCNTLFQMWWGPRGDPPQLSIEGDGQPGEPAT